MKNPIRLFLAIVVAFVSCQPNESETHHSAVQFAIQEIEKAKTKLGNTPVPNIRFVMDSLELAREAYKVVVSEKEIVVTGGDVNGMMYGGLEVAEQLQLNSAVEESSGEPYIAKRGLKFNIPLDARTPSYDDTGDAAQKNYVHMWDWDFWEEFLDDMALHRYNTLSLWNPHPFPSMVKLENYPDVALDDVYVTTLEPQGPENEWGEPQMVSSNVVENLRLVKKMTIDEKIAFWQKVMQHAKDRGIDTYFITWNLCANGAANPVPPNYRTYNQPLWDETPGKYGISNQMDNPINVQYYQESVKTFLSTYPLVKGIGVTAGEHMLDEAGAYTREQWIWEAYGKGMMDAQNAEPGRQVDFIHRVWNTDMDKIMNYWEDYPGSFEVSFKYAKARLYSSPYLNFANGHIEAMKKYGLKSWWNLRNDDIFVHRWGDPDYVRDFIGHFQREHTAGYYMGSDGYVWGKEFASKNPELSGELEIKKHWYNFMMWGRLGYNNDLDQAFFVKKLKQHFPQAKVELLYSGWQEASKIIPQVNVFHWQNWDYQWSVEGCMDLRSNFHSVLKFMDNPTLAESNILNPMEYAQLKTSHQEITQPTPMEIVAKLNEYSKASLDAVAELRQNGLSAEFNTLLDDISGMAYLGAYYSKKIEAATELALFSKNGGAAHKEKAIILLQEAIGSWEHYRKVSEKNYHPQRLARTQVLDWSLLLEEVKKDVSLAKEF